MVGRQSFQRQAPESSKEFSTSAKRREPKVRSIGQRGQHTLRGGHVAEAIRNWQPMGDSVLIERLEPIEQQRSSSIVLTDMKQDGKMILRKGRVLAVGPGKWHPGEWWWRSLAYYLAGHPGQYYSDANNQDLWEWIPGWRETPEVKPGDMVIFNARWNDLAHAENRGSGADGRGPIERPLSYRFDPTIHLVQEADIAGILA